MRSPLYGVLLLLHLQEKVFTPQQMSGLESLMVPPIAALSEWIQGKGCRVVFGARLSDALTAHTAAAAVATQAAGSSHSRQQSQQAVLGQALQELLVQQPPGSSRHYLLMVTGGRRKVREGRRGGRHQDPAAPNTTWRAAPLCYPGVGGAGEAGLVRRWGVRVVLSALLQNTCRTQEQGASLAVGLLCSDCWLS